MALQQIFIEVTNAADSRKISINIQGIQTVTEASSGCLIKLTDQSTPIRVTETYAALKTTLGV